jgi:hypothetical protein
MEVRRCRLYPPTGTWSGVVLAANCRWDDHVYYVASVCPEWAGPAQPSHDNGGQAGGAPGSGAPSAEAWQHALTGAPRLLSRPASSRRPRLGCCAGSCGCLARWLRMCCRRRLVACHMPAGWTSANCGWRRLAGRPWRASRAGWRCMLAWWLHWRERAVDLKVTALAAAGMDTAALKKVAGKAVRARDVCAMRRQARSTVLHHLRVLGDPARHTVPGWSCCTAGADSESAPAVPDGAADGVAALQVHLPRWGGHADCTAAVAAGAC